MNFSNEPLVLPPRTFRALAYFLVALSELKTAEQRDPGKSFYAPEDSQSFRDTEDINAISKKVALAVLTPSTTPEELSRTLEPLLQAARAWAGTSKTRNALVDVLASLQQGFTEDAVPSPREILLATIQATPGLLERFQAILAGNNIADYLALSELEKTYYEQYRQALVAE